MVVHLLRIQQNMQRPFKDLCSIPLSPPPVCGGWGVCFTNGEVNLQVSLSLSLSFFSLYHYHVNFSLSYPTKKRKEKWQPEAVESVLSQSTGNFSDGRKINK